MNLVTLGSTGIQVSPLCMGTLTLGPLQLNLPIEDGAALMCHAIDQGINFFDTAALYDNYPVIAKAVRYKDDIVISSKDYCYDERTAEISLNNALRGIGRDYIDIFMLHEMESYNNIMGHYDALNHLLKRKQAGDIRAIGISTHYIRGVEGACQVDVLDAIHPLYNRTGLGILDGDAEHMSTALIRATAQGLGIFSMKPLGGGHLYRNARHELIHSLQQPFIDAVAVGMGSTAEIEFNVQVANGQSTTDCVDGKQAKRLLIHDWCTGCGACIRKCPQDALYLQDHHAVVNHAQCILCGYCGGVCPELCIKVI